MDIIVASEFLNCFLVINVFNLKKFGFIVLMVGLFGCQSQPIDRPIPIGPNEAFIVINVRSNAGYFRQLIHEYEIKGMGVIFGSPVAEINNPGLKIIKVPCEELYISHIIVGNATSQQTIERERSFRFTPKAGALNYIGDIVIRVWPSRVDYSLIDNESNTINEAKVKYPGFFEKYPYVKNVASKHPASFD